MPVRLPSPVRYLFLKHCLSPLMAAGCVLMTGTAAAQQAAPAPANSRLDVARQHSAATSSATGLGSDLGPLDVRILGLEEVPKAWTIAAGVSGFYTDNATLNRPEERDDFYVASTALVAFEPEIVSGVKGLFAVREDIFRYDDLDPLDFEFLEATAGASLTVPKLPSTVLSVRYVYSRLTAGSFDEATFDEHALNVGLQSVLQYSQSFRFVVGLETQQSLEAQPAVGRRTDYVGRVTFVYEPLETLQLTAGYEGGFFDYGFLNREDFNHVIRLGATVRPVEWLWIGASASYFNNQSNRSTFDYDGWLVGLGAGVEFRF